MELIENKLHHLLKLLDYDEIECLSSYEVPNAHVYEFEAELDSIYQVQVFVKENEIIVQNRPYDEEAYTIHAILKKKPNGYDISIY